MDCIRYFKKNSDLIDKSKCNEEGDIFNPRSDIFIFDRGFRDVANFLEGEFKLNPNMLNFLKKNQKQFTAEQANQSTMCSKIWWNVEAINSLLKQNFRSLDATV